MIWRGAFDWLKFTSSKQKHYPDLGTNMSSIWNFYGQTSDFISRGNRSCMALRKVGCFFTTAAGQWNSLNTGREISYLRAAMSVMFYLLYKHQWNTIAVKGAIWCSHSDGNLFTCYRCKIRNLMFYFYLIWICREVSSHLLTSYQTVLRWSKLEPP